jgi:hypothetical protein
LVLTTAAAIVMTIVVGGRRLVRRRQRHGATIFEFSLVGVPVVSPMAGRVRRAAEEIGGASGAFPVALFSNKNKKASQQLQVLLLQQLRGFS